MGIRYMELKASGWRLGDTFVKTVRNPLHGVERVEECIDELDCPLEESVIHGVERSKQFVVLDDYNFESVTWS